LPTTAGLLKLNDPDDVFPLNVPPCWVTSCCAYSTSVDAEQEKLKFIGEQLDMVLIFCIGLFAYSFQGFSAFPGLCDLLGKASPVTGKNVFGVP
jgi:hypothetical protein